MSQSFPVPNPNDRFELQLQAYASNTSLSKACQLIYGKEDKNLLGSLASTPYAVGRSFSRMEVETLAEELKAAQVSFRFKGKPPLTEVIAFDFKGRSEPEHSSKFPFSVSQIAVAAGILLLIIVSYIFLPEITESEDSMSESSASSSVGESSSARESTNPPLSTTNEVSIDQENESPKTVALFEENNSDALLLDLKGEVSYRKKDSLFWDKAKNKMGLFERDSLRSFNSSYAKILYREGSEILLKPDTFLVIGSSSTADSVKSTEVSLNEGEINARLKASNEKNVLVIKTEQGLLRVQSPQINEKPVQLQTSVANGKTQVSVVEGEAVFEPSNKEIKPVSIGRFQQITAQKDSHTPPIRFRPKIPLLFPPNHSVLKQRAEGELYEFRWEPVVSTAVQYTWALASDKEMSNVLLTQETKGTQIELAYLDPGALYWQVRAIVDEIEYASEVFRLHVKQLD